MKKRLLPALVTLVMVGTARASDLLTTLHFDPELHREANPVLPLLGSDPALFVLVNIVTAIAVLGALLFLYWRYGPALLEGGLPEDPREFAGRQIYGRVLTRGELLTAGLLGRPRPRNWLQAGRFYGFVLPWAVVVGSFAATFSWWAVSGWHWETWRELRRLSAIHGYSTIEPLLALGAAKLAAAIYWRMELRAEKERQREPGGDPAGDLPGQA